MEITGAKKGRTGQAPRIVNDWYYCRGNDSELIATGTKKATAQVAAIKKRSRRVGDLIQQYNDLIPQLPIEQQVTPLDENFNNIAVDDQLWELEMFKSTELWAFHPALRQGISSYYIKARCAEEVNILMAELENYLAWAGPRLDGMETMLMSGSVPVDSRLGRYLAVEGMKTANSLQAAHCLRNVDLSWVSEDSNALLKKLEGSNIPCGFGCS